jgi:catechol 2,3-dioxygenase-like lactoylglutathione lyase family enzyme
MIQHVALELRREQADECVSFYSLLGFVEVSPPPTLTGRARWLEAGATQVHLLWADRRPVHPARGHVAVVADAYEATLAALRAAGHEVDPRAEHWGSPRAYVRDPAGNLVEVMAFGPE